MKKQVYWHKRNGQKILLQQLGDSHLLNIVAVLRRTSDKGVPRMFPKYKDLIAEAIRRGLLSEVKIGVERGQSGSYVYRMEYRP